MKSKELTIYEQSCERFAQYFVNRYFGKSKDVRWVNDEVGGVLTVGNYFFEMNEMRELVLYSFTKEEMFGYYDYALRISMAEPGEYIPSISKYKVGNHD